jgi:hypothetical protein
LHPDLLGLVWLRSSSLQRGPDVLRLLTKVVRNYS